MQRIYCYFRLIFLFTISPAILLSQHLDWEQNYGSAGNESLLSMEPTADGGYIVAGYSDSASHDVSGNHGDNDCWVVKLNSSGSLIWEQNYGGSNDDRIHAIQQTSDGSYIAAGQSDSDDIDVSGNNGNVDFLVIKLSASGSLEWEQNYGGSARDVARSVHQTSDGGYILAGHTISDDQDVASGNAGGVDLWVVKIDDTGAIEWEQTYGGSGNEGAEIIMFAEQGGYMVAGSSSSDDGDVTSNNGSSDYWLMKLDTAGAMQWEQNYGGTGSDLLSSMKPTNDGGYILGGYSHSDSIGVSGNNGEEDFWVVKTYPSGAIEWEQNYGGTDCEFATEIEQTRDGGYMMTGHTQSADHDASGVLQGSSDIWVIKLASSGMLEWEQRYGGSNGFDVAYAVTETSKGGFVVGAYTESDDMDISGNYGERDFWVFRLCTHTSRAISATACGSYTVPSGKSTYSTSGVYTDIIPNKAGCDSIITIDLTVNHVDASVIQSGAVLQSTMFDADYYQWGACNDGDFVPIAGATEQSFTADSDGEYAVVVINNGCADTSQCYDVTITDQEKIHTGKSVQIYPNPAKSHVNIEITPANTVTKIALTNIHGKLIYTNAVQPNESLIQVPLNGNNGVYFLSVKQHNQKRTYKIIKQ